MIISNEVTSFLVKNMNEVSVRRSQINEKILQVSVSRSDVLKNQMTANIVTEIHNWFMFNATTSNVAYIEMEKYSDVFPYQWYATVPFEGVDPSTQFYVFQFTFSPKLEISAVYSKPRKSVWSFIKSKLNRKGSV
jgi:hypothetical protein